jgi:hypothetical protein
VVVVVLVVVVVVVLVVVVVVVVVPKIVVVVELVVPEMVVEVVVVVVEVVVVVPHAGSAGSVQEQNVSPLILHWLRTNFLQALKSAPDKLPHAAVISSAHCFELQSGGAALAPETKTPARKRDRSQQRDNRFPSHCRAPLYGPVPCATKISTNYRGVGTARSAWRA